MAQWLFVTLAIYGDKCGDGGDKSRDEGVFLWLSRRENCPIFPDCRGKEIKALYLPVNQSVAKA
ncbi:MAG: hypothetical protein MSA39_06820 [Prevotella sp.]|nr:hypothetical protein [Prevotella sp.]